MNLTNQNSEKQNKDINTKKTAMSKFIIFSIFLVFFMFGSLITTSILHKTLSDEIRLINQQSYGSLSIILWLPFFLFAATIIVLGLYLDYIMQNRTEKESQKSIFQETLKELKTPTQKGTKKRTIVFWFLLVLSFLVFITSLVFLFLGIAYMI